MITLIRSTEDMAFNNIKISEILTDPSDYYNDYFIVNDVQGRGVNENELNTIIVPGMDGVYTSNSRGLPRHLDVLITIKGTSFGHLREKIDRLSEILSSEKDVPIAFDDEPNIIYYGRLSEVRPVAEKSKIYQAVLTFLCSDPYKYGPERTLSFPTDHVVIENKGTAEADPIFELTATKKTTFAMISNADEEYNMIGRPADVDEQIVDSRISVFNERGETLDLWATSGTQFDNGKVTGEMGTDGTGIHPLTYGSRGDWEQWYGPAIMREIDPIQDFEVEMRLRVNTNAPNELYRIEFYLYDENMNVLGKMAVRDFSLTTNRYAAEGRIGKFLGAGKNYLISQENYLREATHFHGMVRMRRIGQEFQFYVARLKTGEDEGLQHDTLEEIYRDVNNEYQGKLKYVQINIARHAQGARASVPRINAIKVTELKEVTVDQTPYILEVGDKVIFDHKNDDILVNGEPRNDLKNFGGSFFSLKEGFNNLIVTPEDSFETNLRFRERFR